jgi:transcriptional regulator with XRE-family HTH domain
MHYDYEEFRQALAARIKALRKAKGWSQMHMTTDFGYHVSFLAKH